MRKVDPKDEIPVKDLTEEAIKKRVEKFNGRAVNKNSAQQLNAAVSKLFDSNHLDVKRDLDGLYKAIDRYMETNISRFSVCRAGCGYCCSVPVDVSLLEAARISIYLKEELPDYPVSVSKEDKDKPCPFQNGEGKCSIYPVRPLVCRLFTSIDSWHPCRDGKQHYIHTHKSQPIFSEIERFFLHASESVPNHKHSPVQDIREFFGKK